MSKWVQKMIREEPVRFYTAIVSVVALLATLLSGTWLPPELWTVALTVVAILLGIEIPVAEAIRSEVFSRDSAEILKSPSFDTETGAYMQSLVRELLPESKTVDGLLSIAYLLPRYAGELLTDQIKTYITREVHSALRAAGLLKGRDF